MLRTVDTYVIVIAISFAKKINIHELVSEILIALAARKHFRYLAKHEIF